MARSVLYVVSRSAPMSASVMRRSSSALLLEAGSFDITGGSWSAFSWSRIVLKTYLKNQAGSLDFDGQYLPGSMQRTRQSTRHPLSSKHRIDDPMSLGDCAGTHIGCLMNMDTTAQREEV